VLELVSDLDDAEDDAPAGCVQERAVAGLDGRSSRRRMRRDAGDLDLGLEPPLAAPADEQPALH